MVVNFRNRGISRGARKLTRTPMLKKKNNSDSWFFYKKNWKKKLRKLQIILNHPYTFQLFCVHYSTLNLWRSIYLASPCTTLFNCFGTIMFIFQSNYRLGWCNKIIIIILALPCGFRISRFLPFTPKMQNWPFCNSLAVAKLESSYHH
jgi:hypothetical protein